MEEIYRRIFQGKENTTDRVDNPVSLSIDNCRLINTKKERYYIHTYDPTPYLEKLRREYGMSDEILSRFVDTPRRNCCNVISITLYIQGKRAEDKVICHSEKLYNYLSCIYGTVRNTKRKLPDWIVRLYLDESIYKCITQFEKEYPGKRGNSVWEECLEIFDYITNSENVEIYTYICEEKVTLSKTRTYRYLVLIDPEVNISVIREADGYITNLEAHNLRVFERSDKLFYLPPITSDYNLIKKYGKENTIYLDPSLHTAPDIVYTTAFMSYSPWLSLYKNTLGREFFVKHQNLYDILAGTFTFKLKFKPEFYYGTLRRINELIRDFFEASEDILMEKYYTHPDIRVYIPRYPGNYESGMGGATLKEFLFGDYLDYEHIVDLFQLGFDEIFLLDMCKEIISLRFREDASIRVYDGDIELTSEIPRLEHLKQLFFAFDIPTFNFEKTKEYQHIVEELIRNNIIHPSYSHTEIKPTDNFMSIIDGKILDNIICDFPFNIKYGSGTYNTILNHLNISSYKKSSDRYYGDTSRDVTTRDVTSTDATKKKYLKYKIKYLKLKKLI